MEQYIAQNGEQAAQDFVTAFRDHLADQHGDHSDMSGVTDEYTALGESIALGERILPLLETQLAAIQRDNAEFLQRFEVQAKLVLGSLLNTSEERVTAERDRYGLGQTWTDVTRVESDGLGHGVVHDLRAENHMASNAATRGLADAAREMVAKVRALRAAVGAQNDLVSYVGGSEFSPGERVISDQPRYDALQRQIDDLQHDYALLRHDKERDYPILASYASYENLGTYYLDNTIEKLNGIAAGSSTALAGTLYEDVAEKLRNIQTVWENLNSGDLKVWKLPNVIDLTERQMNVGEGSMRAKVVKDRVTAEISSETIINLALGALALALGLLAAIPSGGSSLVAAGTFIAAGGAAGVSAYFAVSHLQEYILESAANGTDFDKARAVSQEDPSLFWLALDIVGAVLDIHAAATAFRALSTTARAALAARRAAKGAANAGETLARLSEEAERLHPGLGRRVAEDVTREAGKAGQAGERSLLEWEETLNQETRNLLVDNPQVKAVYSEMSPQIRNLLSRCASVCIIPNATRQDIARVQELLDRLTANGVELNEEMLARLQLYFHLQADDLPGALRRLQPSRLQRGVSTAEELDSALLQAFRRRAMEPVGGGPAIDTALARATPGTVTGGANLPAVEMGGDWLRSTEGGVGLIPKQVADKLRGQPFNSFDEMREAFWREVAADEALARDFKPGNLGNMAGGKPPGSPPEWHLKGIVKYDLHPITPIEHGGAVYDLDNIVVVAPTYHKGPGSIHD